MLYEEIEAIDNETLCQAVERYGVHARVAVRRRALMYVNSARDLDAPLAVDALPLILSRLRARDEMRDRAVDLVERILRAYHEDVYHSTHTLRPLMDEALRITIETRRP